MATEQLSSPFVHQARDVRWLMWQVVIALAPAVVAAFLILGTGVLIQLAIACAAAAAGEWIAATLRGREPMHGIVDGSAFVMALIIALALPPYVHWSITASATLCASLIGKHAFGSTGHNVFNPAMVGYVFALVCWPRATNEWPLSPGGDFIGPFEAVKVILFGTGFDAVSGATALDHLRSNLMLMRMRSEFDAEPVYGVVAGSGYEWIALAYLLGGLWLCWRGVVALRTPLAFCVALALAAGVMNIVDSDRYAGPLFHLFAGGTMLAAFFVVTDPVTSPTSARGLVIFAAAVAILTYILRVIGPYPDGIAFAVLILNAMAPLIDRFTVPARYGAAGEPR